MLPMKAKSSGTLYGSDLTAGSTDRPSDTVHNSV